MNVPHWRIDGTDRATGSGRTVVVTAPNEAQALKAAREDGVIPSRVIVLPPVEPAVRNPPRHHEPLRPQHGSGNGHPANGDGHPPGLVAVPHTHVVVVQQPANAFLAAILSLLIPGVGQMYRGQVLAGILWLVFTLIGYVACFFPGLVLHVLCIIFAAIDEDPPTVYRV